MTDLKPEDLVKLREIAEKATPGPWSHDRADDPSASFEVFGHDGSDYENFVADCRIGQANAEFIATFDPPMVLSLLADRARMEKALDHALAALVNVTVNWGSTPDDDDAEGWCRQADTKRSVAQTALAQLGWGIDWNAIGRGEKDPAKLLKALGASQ